MVGGEKDKVGEEEGGDHVVEVPMRIQLQVGHGGLVDEGGEGKLLLVNVSVRVVVVDPFSSEEVDKEGEDGQDVDLDADDDEHPLKVEVVQRSLAPLLQHPLVFPSEQDVQKRWSCLLVDN